MAQPSRNASSENILDARRVFFATTKTSMGRRLLQSERNAGLLINVLRSLVAEHRFHLHDFVIMPDHIHLLFEVGRDMTVEKAMQLIKGRFSYRLSKEYGYKGQVWQRGFSEVQVMDAQGMDKCRDYTAANPIKAGLVSSTDEYPFCFRYLATRKAGTQGLKPS
jgi:putative transposase